MWYFGPIRKLHVCSLFRAAEAADLTAQITNVVGLGGLMGQLWTHCRSNARSPFQGEPPVITLGWDFDGLGKNQTRGASISLTPHRPVATFG